MAISFTIDGLLEQFRELYPEQKELFPSGALSFGLITANKQEKVIDFCRKLNTHDSLRLASLIQIDNRILMGGMIVMAIWIFTNFIG